MSRRYLLSPAQARRGECVPTTRIVRMEPNRAVKEIVCARGDCAGGVEDNLLQRLRRGDVRFGFPAMRYFVRIRCLGAR